MRETVTTACCALLMILALITPAQAAPQEATGAPPLLPDTLGFPRAEVRPGDFCLVCGVPLKQDGLAIIYKGRRVPLANGEMLQRFLDDPSAYFYKIQAQGALFNEEAVPASAGRFAWFAAGVWIALALLCGALASSIALRKGLSQRRWFFYGLIFSVVAVAAVLIRPAVERRELPPRLGKIPATTAPQTCPACGAFHHPAARRCNTCGRELSPTIEAEVTRT